MCVVSCEGAVMLMCQAAFGGISRAGLPGPAILECLAQGAGEGLRLGPAPTTPGSILGRTAEFPVHFRVRLLVKLAGLRVGFPPVGLPFRPLPCFHVLLLLVS